MQENKVEVNQQNAQAVLIDESYQRLVVVDFWADWCGPCKSLMPILEKLADEYAGDFLLATVNADDQQMIASQFQVQSLPTVLLMKDGQPIDGFTGAQPEVEIRKLLDTHLPKPWDKQHQQGRTLIEAGKGAEAVGVLREAYEQSHQRGDIACSLAEAYVQANRLDDAEEALKSVRMIDQGPEYQQIKAQLELAQSAEKAPEVDALEKQHADRPDDEEVAFQLAVQYSQHNYHKEALELLFKLLARDLNSRDGEVRRAFTDVIAVLGKGDPLAAQYQSKLYALLY